MKAASSKSEKRARQMEQLMYESYLNAIEQAFIRHKTGIRHTDSALLKFADEIIGKFAAIYANSRKEELGQEIQEIILKNPLNYN